MKWALFLLVIVAAGVGIGALPQSETVHSIGVQCEFPSHWAGQDLATASEAAKGDISCGMENLRVTTETAMYGRSTSERIRRSYFSQALPGFFDMVLERVPAYGADNIAVCEAAVTAYVSSTSPGDTSLFFECERVILKSMG